MYKILIVCNLLCLVGSAEVLTPAEADAIIAAQEAAKAQAKADRLAALAEAEVISEGESILPDGRKVIVREVRPPRTEAAHEAMLVPVAVSATSTAASASSTDALAELQSNEVMMLTGTVYERRF